MAVLRILFLLFTLVSGFSNNAQANAVLSEQQVNELATQFQFTHSPLSFNDVQSAAVQWSSILDERINLGFTDGAVWFKAELQNPTSNTQWYLTLSNTRLDFVDFYLVSKGRVQRAVAGDRILDGPTRSALPTFEFTLERNTSATLLINIKSDTQISFYPKVRGSYHYGEYQAFRKHLHLFYIVLFIFFTLSQFSLYRASIGAMNLFYGAGLLFAFLHIFLYHGDGNVILWPQSPYLKNHMLFVAASLSFLSFTCFLQCYLRTKVTTPRLHTIFNIFGGLCAIFAIAMLFPIPNIVMVYIVLAQSAAISILAVTGTFRCIQAGNRWAVGLAIPLLFSVMALMVYSLTFLEVLPDTQFTTKVILWSLPLDIIMVSGSFVYRHIKLQNENRTLLENLSKKDLPAQAAISPSRHRLNNIDEEKTLNDLVEYLDTQEGYLESGLTLDNVANEINVRSDQLSAVINSRLNTSFSTLLNLKRLNAAAKLLVAEKEASILDISMRCGFGSKSSFNRLFKEQFDTTPTQYRKIIRYNHEIKYNE